MKTKMERLMDMMQIEDVDDFMTAVKQDDEVRITLQQLFGDGIVESKDNLDDGR